MFYKKAALVVALVLQPIFAQGIGLFSSSAPVAPEEGNEGLKQTVTELYRQLQTLQQEIQQLRGEVDNHSRALEAMKTRVQNEVPPSSVVGGAELQRPPGAAVESLPPELVTTQTAPRSATVPVIPPLPGIPQSTAPATSEQGAYDNAFGLLRAGSYNEAIAAFQNFLANYARSPLASNAQYWIGEALYVTRRFREAYSEFQKVASDYPNAPKIADALLKCGYILVELNQITEARQLLEQVVSSFPQTTAAQLAAARLAKMKK